MKKPRVSIITSVYQAGLFVEGLLEDVVSQNAFDKCEWIIIDCNDPADPNRHFEEKFIKKYMEKYSNIIYERKYPDPGVYAAWNIAIKKSKGEYITNWNCDDRRYRHSIERQIEFLDNSPKIDLVYNKQYWHWERNCSTNKMHLVRHKIRDPKEFSLQNLYEDNLPHNDPMWRADLHKKHGYFREDTRTVADHEFWLRCAHKGSVFKKLNDIYGVYYENPEGISTDKDPAVRNLITNERNSILKAYKQ